MSDDLIQRVIRVIAASKRIPAETIALENSLQQLGFDSLDQVNLLFELESEFNISISDQQARSILTVEQVVEGVRQLVAGQAPGSPQPE